ncbi:MAG TPA: hypothetical protein VE395_00080 [Acidimicrobiales bacterium]|nr:hypothetical protein [Acidimicrobiales bacterium]
MLEREQVADHPRRDEGAGDEGHEAQTADLLACRQAGAEGHREDDEGQQEDGLGAGQDGQPEGDADEERSPPGRGGPPPVEGQEEQGERQDEEALRHHQLIAHPQVRVRGGDAGGHEPGPRAGQLSGDGADDGHGRCADERARHLVGQDAPVAEPRHRGEDQHEERRVLGRRLGMERERQPTGVDEPPALGDEAGLQVEDETVVEVEGATGARHRSQPHREADDGDGGEAHGEPRAGGAVQRRRPGVVPGDLLRGVVQSQRSLLGGSLGERS